MKKKIVIFSLAIIMVTYIGVAAYFWRVLFLDLGTNGELGGLQNINNALVLKDINNSHVVYNEIIEIDQVEGYRFDILNKGVSSQNYRLIFREVPPSEVQDGCSDNTTLNVSELNYQLYVNDALMRSGTLKEIANNILYEKKINIDSVDKYELKIWLKDEHSAEEGKHYHYSVDLEVIK